MVGFTVLDSLAKRRSEEDPGRANLDSSGDEEEKEQVELALKFLHSAFFGYIC